jgi:streptomycin 6-kinase
MNSDKIIEHFGEAFHGKVLAALPKYAEQWNLSNFEQIDYYSFSCLFTCVSKEYGACVLKFGLHLEMAETEYYVLKEFDGNGLCKLIKTRPDYAVLCGKMIKAEEICRQLWEKYTARQLLHGDLHHENILMGKDGYCAIDPMGVIGDPVFDIPTFILEEVDRDTEDDYDCIVKTIATKFSIPEQDIRALIYVESCRLNCCAVEDGDYDEVDMDETLFAERMMNIWHGVNGF